MSTNRIKHAEIATTVVEELAPSSDRQIVFDANLDAPILGDCERLLQTRSATAWDPTT